MAAGDVHSDPSAAAGIAPQTGVGVWTYGAWTVLDASLPTDIAVIGVVCNFPESNTNATVREIQVELGIGASGSEVLKVQIPWTIERITAAEYLMPPTLTLLLPEPYSIPAGTRVSARMIHSGIPSSTAQTYDGFHLIYEEVVSNTTIGPVADTGAGTDTATLVAVEQVDDTGAGTDTPTLIAVLSSSDTGAGSDTFNVSVPIGPATDTGSGSDVASLVAAIPSSDTGSGSDSITGTAKVSAADTGAGTDAPILAASLPVQADSGAGTDTSSLQAFPTAADGGTGADGSALVVAASGQDSGTGVDSPGLSANLSTADAGAGADGFSVLVPGVPTFNDNGSGTDAASVSAKVSFSEAGVGADFATMQFITLVADAAAGSDAANLHAAYIFGESGLGTDTSPAPRVFIAATDSGSGADTGVPTFKPATADFGTGLDTATVNVGSVIGIIQTGAVVFSGSGAIPSARSGGMVGVSSGETLETKARTGLIVQPNPGTAQSELM